MSLHAYLQDISAYRLITADEEVALARRIREGDREALDALVCANLRFVVTVARKYQDRGAPLEDLINEGNIGLTRAAERFDETRGVRFISYAVWWVRQAITDCVAAQSHIVHVPRSRTDEVRRIGNDLSLDCAIDDENDTNLLDIIADESADESDQTILTDSRTTMLTRALAALPTRDARVLAMHFGLETGECETLDAIGAALGVTRERVRFIRDRALKRLRHSVDAPALSALAS